ncbi:CAP-associated domain-containing protein [Vagococcus xieshaowenii]|uniref:CAP-associated domain-containing protein n=1 Tax=Vagococcus xieshaowenii TaxID=2562451 RepID=A0AAJ5EFH2_9ENTE|nr:CAP-associated domain-containing protein [Vagococcus xieshaowenii]QCA28374.1 hypothetical protein E4Z98_03250 [Vagococcus xieshaowenii]TFZ42869.1 hypothetical protein E4031_02490 [Vagococcus xieshaowenii]
MKRIKDFLVAVLFISIISYTLPIFFPQSSSSPKENTSIDESIKEKEPTFVQEKLPANGYSKWIGKSGEKFAKQFGEPVSKERISQTHEWWTYGSSANDYYEVLVVNHQIESILILGNEVETDNIHTGMKMEDLALLTTLYSNFSFDYERENYVIELSEEDMNYQPLIAFNNGAFALIQFNQKTGAIIAIRYLSAHDLLTLMPYQLLSGNLLDAGDSLSNASTVKDSVRKKHLVNLFNQLRELADLDKLDLDPMLNNLADELAQHFVGNQETILQEDRLEEFLEERMTHTYERPFYLEKNEMRELEKISNANKFEDIEGLLYLPNQDTSFLAMHLYGELTHLLKLDDEKVNKIGLAFKDDFIVVLLK